MRGFWLVALCGCNSVLGLGQTDLQPGLARFDADPRTDLDRDGIKDVEDPCIAPPADGLFDEDKDTVINSADSCPQDGSATPDSDGDGVGDACDPFPLVAGDRLRCLSAFSDPDFDVAMWRHRDTLQYSWDVWNPRSLVGLQGSIVADWPFEGSAPVTTFDVYGILVGSPNTSFKAFVRAAPSSDASDAGCMITIASDSSWNLDVLPATGVMHIPVTVPSGATHYFRLQTQIVNLPSGGNTSTSLSCQLTVGIVTISVDASGPLPPGYLGFETSAYANLFSFAVYERDDVPPR